MRRLPEMTLPSHVDEELCWAEHHAKCLTEGLIFHRSPPRLISKHQMRFRPQPLGPRQGLVLGKRPGVCVRKGRYITTPSTTTGPPLEEERSSSYDPGTFYPAHIGEVLHGKYRLISKLGWGTGSTVWLAGVASRWPWQARQYVALKIANSSAVARRAANRELEMSNLMTSMWTTHPGQDFVRQVLDSFEVERDGQSHLCLALEPLRQPLWMLGRQAKPDRTVPPRLLKAFLPCILECLDFVHSECQVVHTDLKGDHLMLPFEEPGVIEDYVRHQEASPAPFQERRGRPVYESKADFGRFRKGIGLVKLRDFGLAIRGDASTRHAHDIQPLEYTAPEVMLKAGWSFSADIWNLGLVLWELLAETNLLDGRSPGNPTFSYITRFAQMIRLLGPPPAELLSRADKEVYSHLYDHHGMFKYPELIPGEDFSLLNKTPFLEGEEKALFINLARRMLAWMPEERPTARELLNDPWLTL